MEQLLEDIEFRNPDRVREQLAHLSDLPEAARQRLQALIESSPDPDQAIHFLDRASREAPGLIERLTGNVTALHYLVTTFGYSIFLSAAVLRNPEWLVALSHASDSHRVLSTEDYEARLETFLGGLGLPSAYVLARFRRREMLRIVLRDVLQLGSLSDVTEEISNLADAIIGVSLRAIREEVGARMDVPRPGRFSVVAVGKLGGRELNYSSDIDLMFLYDSASDEHLAKEFFSRVANQLTEMLSTYTSDGLCYRVDLRLRPDGRNGEVCHSLEGAKRYYAARGRDWELQMLIKARVCAGDREPGRELLDSVQPLIYASSLDFHAVESVAESRERIHEKLRHSGRAGLDIKLTSGGIRDIEFLVQCLQRLYGGRDSWVRHGGTMHALFRLRDKGYLSAREYSRLAEAYQFLRQLEHRLQFQEDRQTHALPVEVEELHALARKMPDAAGHSGASASSLERELDEHLGAVRELYGRVIHSQQLDAPGRESDGKRRVEFPSGNLARLLESKAPEFWKLLKEANLHRGQERFEHFLEKAVAEPKRLFALESNPEVASATIDFFDHSAYFSDQLIRHPELLHEIEHACGERQGRVGFEAPEDISGLRRFFREQMVRIQSDSIYHRVDVYRTLKRTSDLAEAVVRAAYRGAIAETVESNPPKSAAYQPLDQMTVVALGRLGMREFDLASDADLVFALRDEDAAELPFWTAVAERIIHIISAYTGDGVLFTVDTRLRPNGRAGVLVQTEATFRDYFAQRAEAWEGIAYMKSRAVAGNLEQGTAFLHVLQEVDWRRYGQGGRSRKELQEMRMRIEKEQGARNPLKAGPGGYYDIDFALLYLRLKGAGIFFKVLNTPERIDVIEKMGHLEREDAEFLRDAATLYRAIDHGQRISTGHAEGSLPTSPAQRAVLQELVTRWTPERIHQNAPDLLLGSTLAGVRMHTRSFFDRIFH